MMETQLYYLIKDVGFPIVIAVLLILDKMKTQERLIKVIENNNIVLGSIQAIITECKK